MNAIAVQIRRLYESVIMHLEKGMPDEALKTVQNIPDELVPDIRTVYLQGICLQETGDYQNAVRCFRGVISADSGFLAAAEALIYIEDSGLTDGEKAYLYELITFARPETAALKDLRQKIGNAGPEPIRDPLPDIRTFRSTPSDEMSDTESDIDVEIMTEADESGIFDPEISPEEPVGPGEDIRFSEEEPESPEVYDREETDETAEIDPEEDILQNVEDVPEPVDNPELILGNGELKESEPEDAGDTLLQPVSELEAVVSAPENPRETEETVADAAAFETAHETDEATIREPEVRDADAKAAEGAPVPEYPRETEKTAAHAAAFETAHETDEAQEIDPEEDILQNVEDTPEPVDNLASFLGNGELKESEPEDAGDTLLQPVSESEAVVSAPENPRETEETAADAAAFETAHETDEAPIREPEVRDADAKAAEGAPVPEYPREKKKTDSKDRAESLYGREPLAEAEESLKLKELLKTLHNRKNRDIEEDNIMPAEPEEVTAASDDAAGPFDTLTMAAVYFRQGAYGAAMRILKLLKKHESDPERLKSIDELAVKVRKAESEEKNGKS